MNDVFGGPFRIIDDIGVPASARPHPQAYADWATQQLTGLRSGDEGIVRFRRPRPTAAFSPQDTAHPDFAEVKQLARTSGFEPIERGTGGRLTMFDEKALGITIVAPLPTPQQHMITRYEILSGAIAGALTRLGIDARVGELPNEYCPGRFSVNAEGRIKLAGVAQRMNQRCYQMGVVVAVMRSDSACGGIEACYRVMELPFDPRTYGGISDIKPSLTYEHIVSVFVETVSAAVLQT